MSRLRLHFAVLAAALAAAPAAHAYGWPVAPFTQQHPIRGFFGDPRMTTPEPYNPDRVPASGTFSFHNGVDIAAGVGQRVYPVASGVVRTVNGWKVVVRSRRSRVFQYVHITPEVAPGQPVLARRTVLGRVQPQAAHVHLAEIDQGRVVNPLLPGHLAPYYDSTQPRIIAVHVRDAEDVRLDPRRVTGAVTLDVEAFDVPPVPVPGPFNGLPVTPVLITWSLSTPSGQYAVLPTTALDFRRTLPSNRRFWTVYGPGTYQSRPGYGGGRYVFRLTRGLLETRNIADGAYVLQVEVADIRGNHESTAAALRICNACAAVRASTAAH
jgi:hypothetical protein